MERLEVSGAVRPIYGSLGVKRLMDTGSLSRQVKRPSVTLITYFCLVLRLRMSGANLCSPIRLHGANRRQLNPDHVALCNGRAGKGRYGRCFRL